MNNVTSPSLDCIPNVELVADVPAEIDRLANHLLVRYKGQKTYQGYTNLVSGTTNPSIEQNLQLPSSLSRVDIRLSPSGGFVFEYFVSTDLTQKYIAIINPLKDYSAKLIKGDKNWNFALRTFWLNDNEIMVSTINSNYEIQNYLIVHADTGQIHPLQVSLPDLREIHTKIAFTPDLSFAAYSSNIKSKEADIGVRIWDVEKKEIIKDIPILPIGEPIDIFWSSKGNYLTVITPYQDKTFTARLSVFDRFGSELLYVPIGSLLTDSEIRWSPNERYIAYQASESAIIGQTTWLHIVDTMSNSIKNVCVSSDAYWSPDSKYIALVESSEGSDSNLPSVKSLFIYDVQGYKLYKLNNKEQIVQLLGWVAN